MNLEDAILVLQDFWEADEDLQQAALNYVTRLLIWIQDGVDCGK